MIIERAQISPNAGRITWNYLYGQEMGLEKTQIHANRIVCDTFD